MSDFRYTSKNRKVSERPLLETNTRDAYMSLEYRELLKLKDMKQAQASKISNKNATTSTYFRSLHRDGEIAQLRKQCQTEYISYQKQYDFTKNDINNVINRLKGKNGTFTFSPTKEYRKKLYSQQSSPFITTSVDQLTGTRIVITRQTQQ
ncbi:hypothetical protein SS50377_27602 [Spironucleus salmonicida]|uniref:Uncharacterized protein n=1 Tax=Spironucleus salmonicida TaxID=348837 RepID=V6LPU2_9EUKA|nr:hypothetical protein SS50377_27602 [Spironucleus salmonicida]|eukprot:EST46620.1 Hypothetical protein SS50377_13424 [Spironucleus salmonicida]